MALYGLFKRTIVNGRRRYTRIPDTGAYAKATAVRVFQGHLINSAFSAEPMELRPIAGKHADLAAPASKVPSQYVLCAPCAAHTHQCEGGECACGCRLVRQGPATRRYEGQ